MIHDAPPCHVLHVAETIRGGIATYLGTLWPRRASRHDGVCFLVPEDEIDELPSIPRSRIRSLPSRNRRLVSMFRQMVAVWRECQALRPDLIHVHSSFAGFYVRLLRAFGLVSAPVVYCAHGWSFERQVPRLTRTLLRLVERCLATQCEAVVCISKSEYVAARRAGLPRRKCFLVYNGIGMAREESGAGQQDVVGYSGPKLLYVGRFDRQKGVDVLVEAMRLLQATSVHLDMVGAPVLRDLSLPNTLPGNVRVVGWRSPSERNALIQQSDAVIVPSRWEGFGLVAAEAMALGKPVIASRVGGLAELVEDRITGRLLAPGDATALASALRELRHEDLADWGRQAGARIRRFFDHTETSGRLTSIYDLLAGEPKGTESARPEACAIDAGPPHPAPRTSR